MRVWGLLLAATVLLSGCTYLRDARATQSASAVATVAPGPTDLSAVLSLDRLPKTQNGLNVDADRAAVGMIGPERTMIVAAPMEAGSGGKAFDVGVFRIAQSDVVFAGDLSLSSSVEGVRIDGGRLIVASAAYRASDNVCCPSGRRTWTYGMMHGKLVVFSSNVSWSHVADAVPPQRAQAPAAAADPPPPADLAARPAAPHLAPRPTPAAVERTSNAPRTRPFPTPISVVATPYAPAPACTETTIYSVSADGSVIQTADGSVYGVAGADQAAAAKWQRGEGVRICGGSVINQDENGARVQTTPQE